MAYLGAVGPGEALPHPQDCGFFDWLANGGECPAAPAFAVSPFAGVRVGGHTYTCSANPLFPLYRCAQWADGQGLTNGFGFPLTITVMGTTRLLTPGGVSPSGTSVTPSTRDESIINAIEGRPPPPGISPWWAVGGLGLIAATAFVVNRRKKGRR